MCGIAGILAPKGRFDAGPIETMVRAIHHRGPDDQGVAHVDTGPGDLWLGNTRLSIIDLSSAGHMPMGETGSRNVITFNGEVYNFMETRRDLESAGEVFSSRTDTETVLRSYRREGVACLRRFRGMFAFALWDAARSELFLARDRAGKKPIYYCEPAPGVWAFASEVRALLAGGLVERRLDPAGVEVYLANGHTVFPRTLVRGIRSLPPGHFIRVGVDGRVLETGPYWDPPRPSGPNRAPTGAQLEECREVFRDAAALRLVSDVPLGVFLSGGMDSSAIVGAIGGAAEDLRTFSIRFSEEAFDESAHARRVADFWKTRHTELTVGRDEFFSWLPDAMAAMDQPTFDGINTYFVSRAARSAGLKVALSGLGADELFGGYPFLKAIPSAGAVAGLLRGVPAGLRRGLLGMTERSPVTRVSHAWKSLELLRQDPREAPCPPVLRAYQAAQTLFPAWTRRALLAGPADPGTPAVCGVGLPEEFVASTRKSLDGLDRRTAMLHVCWRLFLGERCLRDTDTMSMGVSLEVRAPFTDHLFVERMMSIPGSVRSAGIPEKPFERNLLMPWLEGAWTPRPKQGFIMPFREWLAGAQGIERMDAMLRDRAHLESIGLMPGAVAEVWRLHRLDAAAMPWSRVWTLFALADWCRRWRVSL